ncbi:NRDE-2, necessary for RNA interference-domain-containing protein [Fimicolochytrium jonesii]|uniref:NRDE-2, necessary for RNA interference-domain-containing protein n=1 Tax=Fimicolochytrium jonesii TaxID=1396493 RepID=UPI0022FE6629|nr:NRDE-2, necessary for RNA interference-domain-containing protein [Fimicolochytrium jonesii]KAI8825246.1 NRDE-2, necessary for RNA interference-domain-containing protein [Fimicolochytrium jonesii]
MTTPQDEDGQDTVQTTSSTLSKSTTPAGFPSFPSFSTFNPTTIALPSFPSFKTAQTIPPPQPPPSRSPAFPVPDAPPRRPRSPSRKADRKRRRSSSRSVDSDDGDRSETNRGGRKPSKKKKNHRKEGKKRRRSRSRSRSRDAKKREEFTFNKNSAYHNVIETTDFVLDRKGDRRNLAYQRGTSSTLSYKRWGDMVLGAPSDWRIDRYATRKSRDVVVYRYRPMDSSSHGLGKVRYQDFKRVLKEPGIPMRLKSKDDATRQEHDSGDFISIAADPALKSDIPSDVISEDAHFTEETAKANKRLRENPKDLSLWLELIKLQDTLLLNKEDKGNLRVAVHEKKQAIFESALKELPNNEELLCGYMASCQETYETTAILTKWDNVLRASSNSIELWMQYIDFRQTIYGAFSVSSCIELYEDCMDTMRKDTKAGAVKREEILTHLFTRACLLLYQSGFRERAVALYQAIIEFNCFCPPAFRTQTYEQRLGMFESFWESEVPRFGEDGAEGWAANILKTGKPADAPAPPSPPPEMDDEEDEYARFLYEETQQDYRNWLPLREAADDNGIDDPYRTVMFDDVSTLMFDVRHESTRQQLIHNFLHLLSVPLNGGISSSHLFFRDPFLHGELASHVSSMGFWPPSLDSLPMIADAGHSANDSEDEADADPRAKLPDIPIKVWPQTPNTLSEAGTWFRLWTERDVHIVKSAGRGRHGFVNNILAQTQNMDPPLQRDFLPLQYTLEAAFNAKRAAKLAKQQLKTERQNLELWDAYAQIDLAQGRTKEARSVYEVALQSYRTFPKDKQTSAPALYHNLAELEYHAGNIPRAITVLLAFALDEPLPPSSPQSQAAGDSSNHQPTPVKIIKARKSLLEKLSSLLDPTMPLSSPPATLFLHTLACYALTEYLCHSVTDAQEVHERFLQSLTSPDSPPTALEEAVWESYARLLYMHATSGQPFKPAVFREVLERALERYPVNTMMWALYGWNEGRMKVEMRVRRAVDRALNSNPSHILWTFAIWAELHQRQTANANIVRSLFERALDSPSARHSVSLWYLYLHFEAKQGNTAKAKTLVFRAVRECPWCKDIYLLPFGLLRAEFDDDELAEMAALMDEKELRIRASVG